MKRCEICGIKSGRQGNNKRKFLSQFPLNEARCKQWVKVTGNEDLIHIPIEKLHELKYVCDNHFKIEDFNKNRTKLKRNAVPTQNLWCEPMPDEMLKDFPLHVAGDTLKPKNSKKTHISYLEPVPTASLKDHDYNGTRSVVNPKPSTSISTSTSIVNQDASPSRKRNSRPTPNSFHIKNISNSNLLRKALTSTLNSNISEVSENMLEDIPTPSESNTNIDNISTATPANIDDVSAPTPAKIVKLQEKLDTLKNEYKILKKRDDLVKNISSPVLKNIIESAITNSNRKASRHFDEFNKTVAMAIYKNSPKTYKYLSQLFPFPSIRTLLRAVLPMSIDTCINKNILNNLQERTKYLSDNEKICVLVFNTMELKKRLMYNVNSDKIDGYEDFGGDQRTGNIASSVLVTMVQGIRKNFKLPIAHYFFNGNMPVERLATVIESNIRAITESGYEVIATVCDHRSTNMAALNLLKTWGNSPESHYFFIDDKKFFIIYDVPQLLKSIRDNFYQSGEMVIDNKRGKWEHLLSVEKINNTMKLNFHKITKSHVKPNIKPNMKVNCAIEILSNTVAAILKCMSTFIDYRENSMEILQTAQVIEFLDRLFDCTNGPSSKSDIKKNIRENVKKNSFHHTLWNDYKIKLRSTKFINSNDQYTFKNAGCIKGYITTISSLQEIWSYLQSKNIEYLNLRRLNMDGLDDLFTKIRQYCPPFNNPTCYQFASGLKSSLITHLSSPIGQINCPDEGYKTLSEFQKIIFPKSDNVTNGKNVAEEMSEIQKVFKDVDVAPTVCLGGYLALALSKYEACKACINSLKVNSPESNTMYDCNTLREWWKDQNTLTYPTEDLCRTIDVAIEAFETLVQPHIYVKDVVGFCKKEIFKRTIDFSWLCEQHKGIMSEEIIRLLSVLFIRNYCQIANKFLTASTRPNKKTERKNTKAIETEYVAEININQQPFSEFTVYLAPDGHDIS